MTDSEFQALLDFLADEPPAEEVFARLDPAELSPAQRKELALFLCAQAGIRAEIGGAETFARRVMSWAGKAEKETFTARVMDAHLTREATRRTGWRQAAPWALAAAACVAAMSAWWARPDAMPAPAADGAMAVMVDELKATFASSGSPLKSGFAPGAYHLEQGLAHLRMVNGTDLVLKAPVKFDIVNPMRIRLHEGDMRVVVPEMAQGFVVATADVDYLDLGTEFGVSAGTDGKGSSMHVFEGQVDVLKNGEKLESVTLGKGVAFADGNLRAAPTPEPGRYPKANEIGLRRWEGLSRAWRQDPALVAYYTFEREPGKPGQLSDVKQAGGEAVHGTIHGARWVSGRWPGKQALFFDRNDDHVSLNIPGEYESFTVAAWVLLDRLDFPNNAIFASDGWEPGDFHMNLTSFGKPFGGAWPRTRYAQENQNPLTLGVWTLVVLSVDGKAQTSRAWVNGRVATDGTLVPPARPFKPGACRIGGCLVRPDEGNPVRTLRGRVDEVFVWSRALSAAEVTRLYEEGRPSLIEAARQPQE